VTRDGLVGVVLAAGAGSRLRPLTDVRPKPLCPVGDRTLLDRALDRVAPHVSRTAVNAHHHADQLVASLSGRDVHVSLEQPAALGTAGALGALRDWVDGRAVLVTNADAYYADATPGAGDPVGELVAGWDGDRPRLLCVRTGVASDFGELHYVGTALLPWWSVQDLTPVPSGLYEVSWRDLHATGRLELAVTETAAVDCGTPADYLRANMLASNGAAVVEPGAVVEGEVVRSVVWAGERVGPDERLVDAVRAAGVTLHPFATGPGG
jgi:NDP-sugar pyrophosphorylase family protein